MSQLSFFFSDFSRRCEADGLAGFMVAAAGNGYDHVALPAAFPNVLAVGGLDMATRSPASVSRYKHVPNDRYILAPAGAATMDDAFSTVSGVRKRTPQWGTSFSTAFVTGLLARTICGLKGGLCGGGKPRASILSYEDILGELAEAADRNFRGYSEDVHGLGIARYRRPP